jgi:hypothetical protein
MQRATDVVERAGKQLHAEVDDLLAIVDQTENKMKQSNRQVASEKQRLLKLLREAKHELIEANRAHDDAISSMSLTHSKIKKIQDSSMSSMISQVKQFERQTLSS